MKKEIVDFWQIMHNALPNLMNELYWYRKQRSNETVALIEKQKITVFLYNDNTVAWNDIAHNWFFIYT